MIYLVAQILVWIVLTFAVAFGLGWWLRGAGKAATLEPSSKDGSSSLPEIADDRIEEIARERNELQARCEALRKVSSKLEAELETARSTILALEVEREESAPFRPEQDVIGNTTISGAVDPFLDPPSMAIDAPQGSPDDLRQIEGLGKVLEMRLHELGVFHYSQLADLEGYDFNWLAAKLGFSPDRLQEMDWVGQAQRLVAEASEDELETLPGIELNLGEAGEV